MHDSTHCIGTIPSYNDLLNKIFNGVDRMSARLDKRYGCQPSGPLAFPGFKARKLHNTITSVIFIDEIGTLEWLATGG